MDRDRTEHMFDPQPSYNPAMLLSGINHVAVLTKDTDRFHAFYRDVFGATVFADQVISDGEQEGRLSFVTIGPHTELNVFELPATPRPTVTPPCSGAAPSTTWACRPSRRRRSTRSAGG